MFSVSASLENVSPATDKRVCGKVDKEYQGGHFAILFFMNNSRGSGPAGGLY